MLDSRDALGPEDLVEVLKAYRDALRAHQERINRLNVYPVPDGDTGTNMALTMQSVVDEVEARPLPGMASLADALSHGSLMGARGNSGVILSQILRGIADGVRPASAVDAPRFADALVRAREGAYKAVQNPVEGTILTVMSAAAAGAAEAQAGSPASLSAAVEAARTSAAEALERTPEMLPVLRAAGVVDSGGSGLVLLFDAFLHVVDGVPLPEAPADASGPVAVAAPVREQMLGGRFEVMYLLEAPEEAVAAFRDRWSSIGDSIAVVGGDGLYNCHVHTDDIGAAVEAGIEAGRPSRIRVTDLREEVEEERWVREAVTERAGASAAPAPSPAAPAPAAAAPASAAPAPAAAAQTCAVVAVCAGSGIESIFRSLGVSEVVSGGRSMNPSLAEILAALEAAPASQLVLLPNHSNVVAVAEAAARASTKEVVVVPTRDVAEGMAALMDYRPEASATENAAAMKERSENALAGEVTQSVRDSETPAGPVRAGDWIGLSRRGVEVVRGGPVEAAAALVDALADPARHEVVTVIAGEGATPDDTARLVASLGAAHPELAVEVHEGGQPLYPYLLSIE